MRQPSYCAGDMIRALMVRPRTTSELEGVANASTWTVKGYIQMFKATGVIRVVSDHRRGHDELLALCKTPFEGTDDPNDSLV